MNERLIKSLIAEELFGIRICESIEDTKLVNFLHSQIVYPQIILEKLLIGEPVTVPELRDILRNKIVNFEFIKLDGDKRPAKGTTMMKYIPSGDQPTGANPASPKVAAFWDMNKDAWRSVSQKSKEIVLQKDQETGKPKVVISDKGPKEEPVKPETRFKKGQSYNFTTNRGITTDVRVMKELPSGEYQVYSPEYKTLFAIDPKRLGGETDATPEPRPVPEPVQPIVRPSIRPKAPMPIPTKTEEIPKPPVQSVPLNLDDATKLADEIEDREIVAPGVERLAYPEEPVGLEPTPPVPEEEPLPPKEEITFKDEEPDETNGPEAPEDDENKSFEA